MGQRPAVNAWRCHNLSEGSQFDVVHILAPASVGGAESVVRALAVARHRRDASVGVATLIQPDAPRAFVGALAAAGVPVIEVQCGRRRYTAEISTIREILAHTGASLVHTHVYHGDFIGFFAARRLGVPVVSTVHGFTGGTLRNRFYEWLDRRLLRRFDAVICVSQSLRRELLHAGCSPERVHVVPNGLGVNQALDRVEARKQLGLPEDARVIGWIGRMTDEKAPEVLVDAVAELDVPNVVTVYVGNGPARAAVERRLASSPLSSNVVVFAGERADAATLLPAFDLLAITSRTEGVPMVLLEAMSAGVPLVTFAVGGIPEILGPNSAWLAAPGSTIDLRRALEEALLRPDEAIRRAATAREIANRRYALNQWLQRVEEVYDSVRLQNGDARLEGAE